VKRRAIHHSMLSMLSKCGEMARRRYVEGEKMRPGVALIVGTAVHRGADVALTRLIQTGELAPVEEVQEAAAASFEKAWSGDESVRDGEMPDDACAGQEPLLDEEDISRGVAVVKAEAKDEAVRLVALHRREVAPSLRPIAVERRMRLVLDGFPFDLEGTIDVEEEHAIRDLKTSAKAPAPDLAFGNPQLAFYSMVRTAIDGKRPLFVALDVLVKNKTPKYVQVGAPAPRTDAAILSRIERAAHVFEKEAFYPTDPSGPSGWVCSSRYCPFFESCPWGRARRKVI